MDKSIGTSHGKRFGAIVGFEFPEGVHVHPLLGRQVGKMIGRICATQTLDSQLRIAYSCRGNTYESAYQDSACVVAGIKKALGLGHESVIEHLVREHDALPEPPELTIVE